MRPATQEVRDYAGISLSPDGQHIAAVISDERGRDLWIYDTGLGTLARLTSTGKVISADWTHDGRSVVFLAPDSASHATVVWMEALAGGSPPRKLFAEPGIADAATVSPDGASLMLGAFRSTWRNWGLLQVSLDSTPVARPYVASQFYAQQPRFSPDGKWVAYFSNETGRQEVYVRSFPDPSSRVQISVGGGAVPEWSRDGSRLYYLASPDRVVLLAAHLTYSPNLHVTGRDTVVSAVPGLALAVGYGVSPEGKRMLAVDPVSNEFQLLVSPNWITELRRRLAGGTGEGHGP
jgi:serine/threonine-protein kinase